MCVQGPRKTSCMGTAQLHTKGAWRCAQEQRMCERSECRDTLFCCCGGEVREAQTDVMAKRSKNDTHLLNLLVVFVL